MLTPFDLHVLSTPPAFILSQDQTLMFKVDLFQDNVSYLSVANFLISEEKAKLFPCKSLICFLLFLGAPYCYEAFRSLNILKEFSGLHYCLFVKVLVFLFVPKALYLLCFCCLCVSHATRIYYHVSCFVSTTFLNLFEWFYLVINYHLTAPPLHFLVVLTGFSRWNFILSLSTLVVNIIHLGIYGNNSFSR